MRLGNLEACGTCDSSEEYEWDEEKPNVCRCMYEGNTGGMDDNELPSQGGIDCEVVEPSSQEGNTGLLREGKTYKKPTSQGGIICSNVEPSSQEENTAH